MSENVSIPTTLCDSNVIWNGFYHKYGGHDYEEDLIFARRYARLHAPDIPFSYIAGMFSAVHCCPERGVSVTILQD